MIKQANDGKKERKRKKRPRKWKEERMNRGKAERGRKAPRIHGVWRIPTPYGRRKEEIKVLEGDGEVLSLLVTVFKTQKVSYDGNIEGETIWVTKSKPINA